MSNLNASLTTYTFPQTQTKVRTVTVEGALWFACYRCYAVSWTS